MHYGRDARRAACPRAVSSGFPAGYALDDGAGARTSDHCGPSRFPFRSPSPTTSRSARCAICAANYDRCVALPLKPPVKPQLALSRKTLPEGEEWCYEPKYDGFRALAFVDGDDVYLQSRNGRPLSRYFPELRFPRGQYVIDGELVILGDDGLETFDALQNRIHPAESRINMLAEETPARYRAFDLLAVGKRKALKDPFEARRDALKTLIEKAKDPGSVELTPLVGDPAEAEPWLAGGEGVIAKQVDAPYRPGERKGMVKVKRLRTADCVVVGWRHGKEEGTVGSLILGLYDGDELRVVGHTSGLKAKEKRELISKLAPYETGEKGSADPSRWAADRELEWVGLRPELVVEVSFDHVAAGRIRHGSKLLRWREDKDPKDCAYSQLDQ
jgi:ATP-dependent DNA ligase